VERRVGKADVGDLDNGGKLDVSHLPGDGQVVGEVQLLDAHLAKRSSSSLSSSMMRRRRFVNSGSARRRSMASIHL
jgi:hypothetical protein